MQFSTLIEERADTKEIARFLNGLSHAQRLSEVYGVSASGQASLYEMCAGQACTLLGEFVPGSVADLQEVVHWGINSLPVARRFQKRFARSAARRDPQVCIGYNEQPARLFTGPGYFTARDHTWEGSQRVVIDYLDIPTERVAGWPRILPNHARLSRFIYFQTRDWMWKVSDHVTVGRAKKLDNWLDNWFLLCRQP